MYVRMCMTIRIDENMPTEGFRTSLKHEIQHLSVLQYFGIILPAVSRVSCHPRLGQIHFRSEHGQVSVLPLQWGRIFTVPIGNFHHNGFVSFNPICTFLVQ